MDGVISDTQELHAEVESALLAEHGITMTPEEITREYAGIPDHTMFRELFERHAVHTCSVEDAVRTKWGRMHRAKNNRIVPIPYAITLIKNLKREGFKLAIASASPKVFIEEVLRTLRIFSNFDVVVSAYEVPKGKPAPDIFLFAAAQLGVAPREAVVIEDGRSGMVGARVAGMACIGLIPGGTGDFPATILVSSLSEIHASMIHDLPIPR